ncbi:MAG: cytochrome ubiquinol oxidase subunit I, partial [Bacteroidales bacterium]|nr:cytochrome ubiquinol oxidase subunit I [Bacteroidales bacterium]
FGLWFILLFALVLFFLVKDKIDNKRILLKLAIWSIPLGYIASQLGWAVAEVGRQPWTIQDILPTMVSTSHLSTTNVKITFFMFLVLFTILLIAELKIMFKAIGKGPE